MKRRTLLAGCGAGLASALAGCAGAIRRLEFADVSHRARDDERDDETVVVEMDLYATTNVEGRLADFHDVSVAAFTCDARQVGQTEVGTVPGSTTLDDPVRAEMVCETVPDGITLDAERGPCERGVVSYGWAVYTGEEWTLNGFKRKCDELLPPRRICRAIGKERPPGPVRAVWNETDGNGTDGNATVANGTGATGGIPGDTTGG